MNRFHLIMPMGGNGSRFSSCGFDLPKPLIPIYGKPFFYWAVQSILKFNEIIDLTFVILKEHIEKFDLDKEIKKYFADARIVVLNQVLNGPVLTCLEGIKEISDDEPILFNDCDHLFKSTAFNLANASGELKTINGALITFKSDKPQFSYIVYENGEVVGTIEKKVLSNDAICGAYFFESASLFKQLAKAYFSNCNYSEFFISGMYNELAKIGGTIKIYCTDYHIPFGIPEEYEIAKEDLHYLELE